MVKMRVMSGAKAALLAGTLAAAVFAGMALTPPASICAARTPDMTVIYRIERDSKPVGSYHVRLFETREGADVDTRLSLATRVGPFKVRIAHEAAEAWTDNGQLRQLASKTDRNGDLVAVKALTRADGQMVVEAEGKTVAAAADVLTNSFTHTGARFASQPQPVQLLDVLSGALRPSTIIPRGSARIACATGSCAARLYDIRLNENGKVSHQLWLDEQGMVLKMIANTRFGVSFTYVREQIASRSA